MVFIRRGVSVCAALVVALCGTLAPDELIFAKHKAGHVYCGEGTDLRVGDTGFTDDFCELSLPPPEG